MASLRRGVLFEMVKALMNESLTVTQLAARLDVSTRTVYRYLRVMEDLDVAIDVKVRVTGERRFIAQDKCPLCGMEVKHE